MGITFLKSILNRMRGKQGISRVSPSKTELVKSFKDDQEKEAAFDYKNRGIQSVPVAQIVGSVG